MRISWPALPLCLLLPSLPAQASRLERAWDSARGLLQDPGGQAQAPAPGKPAPGTPANEEEGPKAALAFEMKYRGRKAAGQGPLDEGLYPDARPIPFSETPRIIPMRASLWTRQHLIDDFNKSKRPGEEAIIVIVKTELCVKNKFRACSVATAALEKRSTPLLRKFRVYGAWINNPASLPAGASEDEKKAKTQWDERVALEHDFSDGPGAKLLILDPLSGAGGHTNAAQLQLTLDLFETNAGQTPRLDKALEMALKRFADIRARLPKRP